MIGKCRGFSHCLYKKKNPRFDYFDHWIPSRFVLHPGTGRGYFVECELMGAASVHTRFLSWARKGEISVMVKTYSNKYGGCGKHAVVRVKLRPYSVVLICHWTLRRSMCTLSFKTSLLRLKRTKLYSNLIAIYYSFFQFYPLHKLSVPPKGIQETEWNLLWVVM